MESVLAEEKSLQWEWFVEQLSFKLEVKEKKLHIMWERGDLTEVVEVTEAQRGEVWLSTVGFGLSQVYQNLTLTCCASSHHSCSEL